MVLNLQSVLPVLVPKAIAWAHAQAADAARMGNPLQDTELEIARQVGVARPERIRVAVTTRLPQPEDPELKQAAEQSGLLGPNMAGLTLGYAIFIRYGQYSVRLLSHECRHVHQYEQAGSIEAFLRVYLEQIATVGYSNAPLEIDARAHEIHSAANTGTPLSGA